MHAAGGTASWSEIPPATAPVKQQPRRARAMRSVVGNDSTFRNYPGASHAPVLPLSGSEVKAKLANTRLASAVQRHQDEKERRRKGANVDVSPPAQVRLTPRNGRERKSSRQSSC